MSQLPNYFCKTVWDNRIASEGRLGVRRLDAALQGLRRRYIKILRLYPLKKL
jgi:hypothetical protein